VPTISVAQFLPSVQALTEALDAAGYQLILGQSGYDHAREEALLNTMIGRRRTASLSPAWFIRKRRASASGASASRSSRPGT
jgi:hypothetical protein